MGVGSGREWERLGWSEQSPGGEWDLAEQGQQPPWLPWVWLSHQDSWPAFRPDLGKGSSHRPSFWSVMRCLWALTSCLGH